jgi:hypothetical protein
MFSSGISPTWAPLGNGWYDSLQAKVTKRLSYGLMGTMAFTYSDELASGQAINDVYNRPNQKSLVSSSQPFLFVAAFTYELYDWVPHVTSSKFADRVWKGWKLGGIMRYSSGLPIGVPGSTSNMNSLVFQSTRMNRVAGQPLFLKNLNCHCIDPTKDLVLNSKAWADVPNGQWGYSTPYYNDYRGQRLPSENLNLARIWNREKFNVEFRVEFYNVFNRLQLPGPSSGNPLATTTTNSAGQLTGGFGYINASSVGGMRNGQFVIRVKF